MTNDEFMEVAERVGGFAFPASTPTPDGGEYVCAGMSLRDWFAGQALASGKARETLPDYDLDALFGKLRTGIRREEILAAEAYRIADAMLAERSK